MAEKIVSLNNVKDLVSLLSSLSLDTKGSKQKAPKKKTKSSVHKGGGHFGNSFNDPEG